MANDKDILGVCTPFTDSTVSPMPFKVVETLGSDPAAPVDSSQAFVTGRVTPVELPINQLFFGGKGGK